MFAALLFAFVLPALSAPLIYLVGKKSVKISASILLVVSMLVFCFLSFTIPKVLSEGKYVESYRWISSLGSSVTLFVDGISLP